MDKDIIWPFDACVSKPHPSDAAANAYCRQKRALGCFHREEFRTENQGEPNALGKRAVKSSRKSTVSCNLFFSDDDSPFFSTFTCYLLCFFIRGLCGFQIDDMSSKCLCMECTVNFKRCQQIRCVNQSVSLSCTGFKNIASFFQDVNMLPNCCTRDMQVFWNLLSGNEIAIRLAKIIQNFISHNKPPILWSTLYPYFYR